MSAEFFDFKFQSRTSNQGSDFGAQAYRRLLGFMRRIPQNLADFFLHAMAVAPGTALQAHLNAFLELANYDLRHWPSD